MSQPLRKLLGLLVPPLALFGLVLVVWHLLVVLGGFKPYLLPGPLRVADAISANSGRLVGAFLLTGTSALTGFLISLVAGTLVACLFSQSAVIRRSAWPYAIFLQTVPIIAIAPLVILWFGRGFWGVVAVVVIISVFPIIANATQGLIAIDRDLRDLFRIYGASRGQILWKLRLPHALPALCTGAETSSGLAVVGAIVGEFYAHYGGRRNGLGFLIRLTTDQSRTDELFAAVLTSTLLGLVMFGTVSLVSQLVLSRWSPAGRDRPGIH